MKRSEVNALIEGAKSFFDKQNFHLPPWAYWRPSQWKGRSRECSSIINNKLGWDITDFGSGYFARKGLLLFTLRNGQSSNGQSHNGNGHKSYTEKIMIVRENQETPFHFHRLKTEDIINRGGGHLAVELYASNDQDRFDDKPLTVKVDGINKKILSGDVLILRPGQSITIEPNVFHRFYGVFGKGTVLVGEVSQTSHDNNGSVFLESTTRFPKVSEDHQPLHLLINDYPDYV